MDPILLISDYNNKKDSQPKVIFFLFVLVITIYLLLHCQQSVAISWTITPTVQTQEIYSDNINLASSGNEKAAFVTSVNPGFSIKGQSTRSTMTFNYRMQNLYNAGGNNGLSIYNQLQSNSNNVLIPNKFFIDSNSSISQQNINNNLIGTSNINGSNNNTTVYNIGVSPYWTPRFANYASGIARMNFNTISTGGGNVSNNTDAISDSVNLAETINLQSGTYFQRINWNFSFNNNENYRIDSPTISFQNTNGRLGVPINAYFNVFTQGGYSSNNYQSTSVNTNGNTDSGAYYTVGCQWRPSQRFNITAGAGNNSFVTVFFSPMSRLTTTSTYSNNAVGTNFGQYSPGNTGQNSPAVGGQNTPATGGGNSGQNWTMAWNYQAKRSKWTLTHNNTTTTSQQILGQNQIFPAENVANNQIGNSDLNRRIINNPTLTNQVIVTKTWNFSSSFTPGKSTFSANVYSDDYTYQTVGNNQNIIGANGTWNWPFASKTSAYLRPQWQHIDNQGSTDNSQYYTVAIGINRNFTSRLNGVLEFRHMNQTSNGNENNDLPGGLTNDYQENRVTASIFMRF
jgi:hypothetical protein